MLLFSTPSTLLQIIPSQRSPSNRHPKEGDTTQFIGEPTLSIMNIRTARIFMFLVVYVAHMCFFRCTVSTKVFGAEFTKVPPIRTTFTPITNVSQINSFSLGCTFVKISTVFTSANISLEISTYSGMSLDAILFPTYKFFLEKFTNVISVQEQTFFFFSTIASSVKNALFSFLRFRKKCCFLKIFNNFVRTFNSIIQFFKVCINFLDQHVCYTYSCSNLETSSECFSTIELIFVT